MIQSLVTDVGRASLLPYSPPDHSVGEAWPGEDRRSLRQLTLLEQLARRTPSPTATARTPPPSPEPPKRATAGRRRAVA